MSNGCDPFMLQCDWLADKNHHPHYHAGNYLDFCEQVVMDQEKS